MFSIDQNCHSLWDVLPKLHALRAHGNGVRHFVEDIDVAFTSLGADPKTDGLRLKRERFYRGGGQDWGAALFYCEFLGRLPLELHSLEPFTGMSTRALAGKLGRSVDQLYEELSPSDNWQLIGPSYVGDRDHHRLIGDLSVAETQPFLRDILRLAREDVLRAFPSSQARRRTEAWFDAERLRLDDLLDRFSQARLVDLYRHWLAGHLGDDRVELDNSSTLFAVDADAGRAGLLGRFVSDYDLAAALYNEALAEADSPLRPLDTARGELPFFATLVHNGRLVRTGAFLAGNAIRIADRELTLGPGRALPIEALRAAGILALSGKAILLVIQMRCVPGGAPLAVPFRGSLYMDAAHRLAAKLSAVGWLSDPLHPLVRVRLGLLDRIGELDEVVRLPEHLADAFGGDEVTTRYLADFWEALSLEATHRLESFRSDVGRRAWQVAACPDLLGRIDELETQRRELARQDSKSAEIRQLHKRQKALQVELLERTVSRICRDIQLSQIDYWDSRGAILPWAVAMGGRSFYNSLVAEAQVYEESPAQERAR